MDETSRNKLWEAYANSKSAELREQIIIEYASLVKFVAGRLNMYLGYNVEYDDLVGYGVFGLIDAIDKFDAGKGVKFETYASLRIRGAILDQIRKMDWIPRSIRQKQKKIDIAYQKLENDKLIGLSDENMANEIGISVEEYNVWQNQTKLLNVVSLDEFMEQDDRGKYEPMSKASYAMPEDVIEKSELKQILMETLEGLTDKERKVVLMYYYEELTLKEISCVLEVSESRVSQLHTKALNKMKQRLKDMPELLSNIY